MSRRVSLPGADELFRTTGGMALQPSTPRRPAANGEAARVPAPAGESDPVDAAAPAQQEHAAAEEDADAEAQGRSRAAEDDKTAARKRSPRRSADAASGSGTSAAQSGQPRRRTRGANRRPSGRERHDEKITVYVSAEELMDLEHARLVLRGEHGLAVDRGRIVREAVAVVLADLEQRGDASILVRRLRGR
ncbi:hypothetical protein [Streptomyces sp. MUM 178J]|uniref:hypothetical protein n=1 Tax=Streptomyces sp. MUM 178J TaxID=2791991 RepID=UPI002E7BAC92|nr:hypothetical protein [Streptomyces sp. MUM 178J]WRQ78722.1 hypothetical protein I3F59_004625 [Streptomyces sp. MUM 178J]